MQKSRKKYLFWPFLGLVLTMFLTSQSEDFDAIALIEF